MMEPVTITFYRIYNDLLNLNYIGKTTDYDDRVNQHKSDCYNLNRDHYNFKLYKTIRANEGFDNFKIMIIDTVIFNKDDIEIKKMEQKFIELYNGNLNSNRAYVSIDDKEKYRTEYRDLNKETLNEKQKEYYELNKEKNREQNKKKCKQYYELNKEKCKQYYELNKDKIKQNYQQNKDYLKEKYSCLLCRGQYTTENISTHNKTQKHKTKLINISKTI